MTMQTNPGSVNQNYGYAAQSLGLSPNAQGGTSINQVLRDQLAEQARKRLRRQPPVDGMNSAAAFDLFGATQNGR